MLGFLRRVVDELGQTIVMVTHDPVAAGYTDRVVFLADGRVVDELREPTAERVLDGDGPARPARRSLTVLRASWRSLLARKLRLFMSAFAIILGVAFVSGSFIFTDTLGKAFTGHDQRAVGDVVVRPGTSAESGGGFGWRDPRVATVPASLVDPLAAVPGAERADGARHRPSARSSSARTASSSAAPALPASP